MKLDGKKVLVTGGSSGTLTFDGTIDVTDGLGLQFSDADGSYNFNGQVTLSGGDAGIDILGGSAGTFTFTNTDITSPTGVGLDLQSSNATVNFGAGSSITPRPRSTPPRPSNTPARTSTTKRSARSGYGCQAIWTRTVSSNG